VLESIREGVKAGTATIVAQGRQQQEAITAVQAMRTRQLEAAETQVRALWDKSGPALQALREACSKDAGAVHALDHPRTSALMLHALRACRRFVRSRPEAVRRQLAGALKLLEPLHHLAQQAAQLKVQAAQDVATMDRTRVAQDTNLRLQLLHRAAAADAQAAVADCRAQLDTMAATHLVPAHAEHVAARGVHAEHVHTVTARNALQARVALELHLLEKSVADMGNAVHGQHSSAAPRT
jgi:hypothetical protein